MAIPNIYDVAQPGYIIGEGATGIAQSYEQYVAERRAMAQREEWQRHAQRPADYMEAHVGLQKIVPAQQPQPTRIGDLALLCSLT